MGSHPITRPCLCVRSHSPDNDPVIRHGTAECVICFHPVGGCTEDLLLLHAGEPNHLPQLERPAIATSHQVPSGTGRAGLHQQLQAAPGVGILRGGGPSQVAQLLTTLGFQLGAHQDGSRLKVDEPAADRLLSTQELDCIVEPIHRQGSGGAVCVAGME